jgi:hypothetical protein
MPLSQKPGKETGWVLVNVEGKKSPEAQSLESEHPIAQALSPGTVRENGSAHRRDAETKAPVPVAQTSISAAKAIVMIDALESKSKSKPSRDGPGLDVAGEKGANVKRFFSMNRKIPVSSSDLEVFVASSTTDPGRKGNGVEKCK